MKKTLSALLLASFFSTSLTFAQPGSQDSYQAPGAKKTILCLVDAQNDPLSRRSFENLLESVIEKEKIRTVFTEAGASDLSLSIFRNKVSLAKRQKIASVLLNKGLLQAGEYLTLASDRDLVYWGVENPLLYETFIHVYEEFEGRRAAFEKKLETLGAEESLKGETETSKNIGILLHLADMKASPEEIELYREHPEKFDPQSFPGVSEKDKTFIDTALTLKEFYSLVDQREVFFVENMLQKMESEHTDRAILVMAPIHRYPIAQLFKDREISYEILDLKEAGVASEVPSLPAVPRPIRAQLPYEEAAGKKPMLWTLGRELGLDTEDSLKVVKDLTDSAAVEIVTRKGIKNPSFQWVEDENKPLLKNSVLVETIFEIERRFDVEKYKAFKAFSAADKKEAMEEAERSESKRLEGKVRAYERALTEASRRAEDERADILAVWKKTGQNIKTAYDRSFALQFVTSSFSAVLAPFLGPVFSARGPAIAPVIAPFPVDRARLERVELFLKNNVTAGGMPLTYKAPPGYWASFKSPMDDVDAVMERLLVTYGLSIYDGALWQMALAISGGKKGTLLADSETDRLLSGSSGDLRDIRAYDPIFRYGDEKKIMPKENAYFFRMIADEYIQKDPMGLESLEGFPNFALLHHEDWKPITGEQAWAAIIGPLQVAYVKYGRKIPMDCKEMQLALSILPAVQAMRSKIGGIYHVPWGTNGKNPHDISSENNFSMHAALRMLDAVLKENNAPETKQVEALMRGEEYFFRHYAFDKENDFFYQGGFYIDGKFIPTKIFAVDCQTWALNSLGPEWIDDAFGEGTSYRIWRNLVDRAAYFSQGGALQGVGFSDGHRILSVEWTCGAILAAEQLARYYQASHPSWSRSLDRDAIAMRYGIDEFKMMLPDGSEAYLYSNERYFIPFGWWANPIPNLASSAWVILMDLKFNPFILGGGPNYQKNLLNPS